MSSLPKQSRRAVFATYVGMWAEHLVRAVWPLIAVALAALGALLLFDVALWPVEGIWIGAAAVLAGAVFGAAYAIRQFTMPRWFVAQHRVDARLPGRPLQALQDHQATATDDPAAQAVWAAHQDRMRKQAEQATRDRPDMRVSDRDPFALRYVAVLIAALGLLFGSLGQVADRAVNPGDVIATGPAWEGWVRPPAYTRKPSVYLNDVVGQSIVVPEGSDVILRLYGDVGALTVAETVSARVDVTESVSAAEQQFQIAQSGRLEVRGPGGAIWSVVAEPDDPPRVQLSARFETTDRNWISQRFLAQDDYGVVAGRAFVSLHLDEVNRQHGLIAAPMPRDAYELQLPLTISGDRRQFEDVLTDDLSKNPWVGLPVRIVLEVEDVLGQTGRSATVETTLPGRRFFDPLAKALIEQRRDILWSPVNGPRLAQILRAISVSPDDVFRNPDDAASLRQIIADLEAFDPGAMSAADMDKVAEALWLLALEIEEGELADARAALERAQEKLEEAIRNGASPEEIARLMDELREAQRDYMREFAERNPLDPQEQRDRQNGEGANQDENMVSPDDLAEMMDRLEQLMEEGRMAEAMELLEEINRLMENLQMAEGQGGEGQQSEGQQAMEGLADTLRQQQQLSDDAFRDLQDGQPGQNQQGQPGQQQGQDQQGQQQGQGQNPNGGDQPGDGQTLAERQEALRLLLEQQRRNLPAPGSETGDMARESLDQAEGAMRRAERDLREGDIPGAIDNQAQAMEALREGMRNLGQALAEQQQQQQNQGTAENQGFGQEPGQFEQIDPLGRNTGNPLGSDGPDGDMVTQQDLRDRSQELIDEIQRRGQDLNRSEEERNYLQRLLDQF